MNEHFYKQIIEESLIGYAYHKVICDKNGIPCDFEFIEVNNRFEEMTGLKVSETIGKKVSEIGPYLKDSEIDWMELFGEIAITGSKKEFEYYSEFSKGWYRVSTYSPENNYLITVFSDISEINQSEEQLRTSCERMADILEGTNVGTWEWKFPTGEIVVNERLTEMLGYNLDEISPVSIETWLKFMHHDDLEKSRAQLKQAFVKEIDCMDLECRLKHKDGNWVWVQIRGTITSWTSDGRALFMSGTHIDITDRKQIENELRKSEEKYRLIFEQAPLGVFHFDSQGMITDCNENFVKIIGSSRKALIGVDTLKLPNEEVVKAIGEALGGNLATYEGDYKSVTADKITPLRIMFAPILSDDEEIEGGISIVADISDQKHMEAIIYDEKERFKTTLLSVGDGVISTDNHGKILILNKVAEQMTGWTQEEAFGKSLDKIFNIFNEFSRERCDNPASRVLETGRSIELESNTILISKEGIERSIEDSAAPIMDEDNRIKGVVLVFRDVTEKKKKQKEIEFLSFHDQLTGVYNRRFFEEELTRLDTERNLPLSMIIADVNGLKLANDAFGHMVGDEVLRRVADVIKKECRADEIIARIGGDEFVILLPKTSFEVAELVTNRIKEVITKEKIGVINLSVSFGWETKQKITEKTTDIYKKAEDRMYRNKLSESKSMRYKTVETIVRTLHEKSERKKLHSERVSQLCELMGFALSLSTEDIGELKTAGAMHDIGKIAIDFNILNKPGKLSDTEWIEIERHPETGYHILRSLNEFSKIAEYVLAHHERWDGKGYPKGLKGENIPLKSRIVAIADSYDAMTTDRPYRKKLSNEAAIEEIKKHAGTQFDPAIVQVFIEKVLKRK